MQMTWLINGLLELIQNKHIRNDLKIAKFWNMKENYLR